MVEFQRGIGFLVLAIGIYGIGEMLWTLEHTKGKVQVQAVKVTWERFKHNFGAYVRAVSANDDTWLGPWVFRGHPARCRSHARVT